MNMILSNVPLQAQLHPHKMAVLTGLPPGSSSSIICLCSTSSRSDSACKSHIDIFWIPDAHFHVDILQELQTCASPNRTLISPESVLSHVPWLLTLQIVQHNSMYRWLFFNHLSPTLSLVPVPIVSFLYYSFITVLLKSDFLPFKLYTAARKDWKLSAVKYVKYVMITRWWSMSFISVAIWSCMLFISNSKQPRLTGHLSGAWVHLDPSLHKAVV